MSLFCKRPSWPKQASNSLLYSISLHLLPPLLMTGGNHQQSIPNTTYPESASTHTYSTPLLFPLPSKNSWNSCSISSLPFSYRTTYLTTTSLPLKLDTPQKLSCCLLMKLFSWKTYSKLFFKKVPCIILISNIKKLSTQTRKCKTPLRFSLPDKNLTCGSYDLGQQTITKQQTNTHSSCIANICTDKHNYKSKNNWLLRSP